MIEQYKKEVSQIVASETFQQQLIHAMAEKQQTKHDVNWRPVIIYLCIFFLCLSSIFLYQFIYPHPAQLQVLDLSPPTNDTPAFSYPLGGFGTIGTLGNDPNLFHHNHPYPIKENETLPVYANLYANDDPYLSNYPDDEMLPVLEEMAKRLHIQNYTIQHFDDPNTNRFLMNSNIYLQCDQGKLILFTKNTAYFMIDEDISIDLGGDTQEEVLAKFQSFLKQQAFIQIEDPWIDVTLLNQLGEDKQWNIYVSEKKKQAKDTFIEQQFHSFVLTTDHQGRLQHIACYDIDTSSPVGSYPVKTEQEAINDLKAGMYYPSYQPEVEQNAAIAYSEIVYDTIAGNAYYLPYYKFYVLQNVGDEQYYSAYYVIAIQNKYIQTTKAEG